MKMEYKFSLLKFKADFKLKLTHFNEFNEFTTSNIFFARLHVGRYSRKENIQEISGLRFTDKFLLVDSKKDQRLEKPCMNKI